MTVIARCCYSNWIAVPVALFLTAGMTMGSLELQDVENEDENLLFPSPPTRQELYEAAEDMWARVHALNTLAPEFQGQNNTEMVAQVGGEVKFSCYTYHLSDEMVTWLKRDDDYLITVGQQVYATETRFSVVHSDHAEAWELWIKDVQESDAGQYECQLTTYPPVSFFFNLVVTRAEAAIRGPSEVHVEESSLLSIECHVLNAPVPPVYIFWYHNNSMVNYGRHQALGVKHTNYSSILTLAKVRATDAGMWTCEPYLAVPANITVHVVSGKQPAAMQHGRKGDEQKSSASGSSSALLCGDLSWVLGLLILCSSSWLLFPSTFWRSSRFWKFLDVLCLDS